MTTPLRIITIMVTEILIVTTIVKNITITIAAHMHSL